MVRRVRVAHCIETLHLGGVEHTRLAIARGLDPADAIARLAAIPEERAAMGRTGARRAEENFGQKRYAEDIDRLYAELVAGAGVRGRR